MEFRVSVCLTRYFNDERSYCYVYLDKTYDTVAAFGRYLRRQFRLKNNFCLMTNNNLLPDDQTIKIIQPGDVVTVIPLQKIWWDEECEVSAEIENGLHETTDVVDGVGSEKASKKKKKKKSKSEAAETPSTNEEEHIPPKKEKSAFPESTENESTKKKDADMDVSMGSDGDREIEQDGVEEDTVKEELTADENSQESDTRTQEPQKITDVQSAIQQLKLKALSLLNEVAPQKAVAGVSRGRINKRKRIRKRNKNTSLSVSTPDLSDSAATAPINFKPVMKSASHIRFDSEQPAVKHNTVRNTEITTKPRIIHAIESNSTSNSRRTSVCGFPLGDKCCIDNLSENITVNGKDKANGISQVNKEPTINIESLKKRLSEFPVMDDVYPVPKDLIMFKMLKMGSDYTPSFSDHILADVLEIDKTSGVVKVSIRDGQKECIPVSGKFDLEPLLPEEDLDKNKLIIDIVWGQVTEPRLIPNKPGVVI